MANRSVNQALPSRNRIILGSLLGLSALLCQNQLVASSSPERDSLQQQHIDDKADHPSFFASPPIHHVIPERNMITLSADVEQVDRTISWPTQQLDANAEHYLKLGGWNGSLLMNFAAKSFGVGFLAELGEKTLEYRRQYEFDSSASGQESTADYSGLGTYVAYIPKVPFLPNFINTTLILGYKELNVVHDFSGYRWSNAYSSDPAKFSYDTKHTDVGANVAILLAKRFTVFPWLNYRSVQISKAKLQSSQSSMAYNDSEVPNFEADQDIFWNSDPNLSYGLDFAAKFGGFDIHLGGLFGIIANFNKGTEQIDDGTLSVGLTYSFKSR